MAVIAIDAGTSVIKAVAYSEDGQELACARRSTAVLRPSPQHSEQSMEAVMVAVNDAVRAVASRLQEPVTALCTTAQGDGCWPVDRDGLPLGHAMLWNDGRSTGAVERWHQDGTVERARRITGSVTYPGLANALLQWMQEHDVERLRQTRWVLTCNGWIFSQLTGQIAVDLSDASNPFCDLHARAYSDEALRAYGLQQHRDRFPAIARADALCGRLTREAAAELRLPGDTAVIMAPYDIVTTAYGVGAVSAQSVCLILGTTICAESILPAFDPYADGDGTTLALEDNTYLRAMPTLCGCETLEWAAAMLGVASLEALSELAASAEACSAGLHFLPYLSEAGERSPFLDPRASGSWLGLKRSHRREHLARAVYEGLCFSIQECVQLCSPHGEEIRVAGGGARSDFWCQLIADVTGQTVLRATVEELGTRGAFLFSQVVRKRSASIADACARMPLACTSFRTRQDVHAMYDTAYCNFLQLRNGMRPVWRQLPKQGRS